MERLDVSVRTAYQKEFLSALDDGRAKPLILPYSVFGAFILPALWLTIPHTSSPWVYRTRWPVMVFVVWFNVHIAKTTSSTNFACAYAAGLTAMWGIILSANALIWRAPQFDVARVMKVSRKLPLANGSTNGSTNGVASGTSSHQGYADVRRRRLDSHSGHHVSGTEELAHNSTIKYIWEPYPAEKPWLERLGWVLDLLTSFRGAGWSWSINSIPRPSSIPKSFQHGDEVDASTIPTSTPSGYTHCVTERELVYSRVGKLVLSYLLLDFLSVFMMKDPYFILGPDTTRPYTLPPYLQSLSSWHLLFYRELMSLAGVWSAILAVFNLGDLVQYFLCKFIFPSRAALWLHASTFGSFSQVLDRGLAGWWGSWWHQSFRLEFLGPSAYLISKGYVKKGSPQAQYAGLLFSFIQSGLMHGAGSLTSIPDTKPWRSLVFFLLQGVGVAVQHWLTAYLRKQKIRAPTVATKVANLAFALLWLYVTAPLFIDDMASTGLWMLEPVPISPLRWLGLGHPADHWWRWDKEQLPKLYRPQHWWEVGIAL